MSFLEADSFTFHGKNSKDFNLKMCWMDKPDLSANGLKRTSVKGSLNGIRLTTNHYGMEYENNISFSFCIVKKDYCNFDRSESIAINEWLLGANVPQVLAFHDNEILSLHYYAVCTSIEDMVFNGHVGKQLQFETTSPYGFMHPMRQTYEVTESKLISIHNMSDTDSNLYFPSFTLQTNSDVVTIENITDKKSVTFDFRDIAADADGYKRIHIDAQAMRIKDSSGALVPLYKLGFHSKYASYVSATDRYTQDIYWLRLLPDINDIRITGNCSFTIQCEFPRRVGCL